MNVTSSRINFLSQLARLHKTVQDIIFRNKSLFMIIFCGWAGVGLEGRASGRAGYDLTPLHANHLHMSSSLQRVLNSGWPPSYTNILDLYK